MKFDVDLTKVERLKPKKAGLYILKIISSELKKSRQGLDKLTWQFEVLKPELPADESTKFWYDTSLAPKALFHLSDLFDACGKLHPGPFDPIEIWGDLVGAVIELEVTPEFGERNRVTKWVPVNQMKEQIETLEAQRAAEPQSQPEVGQGDEATT